MAVTKMVKPNDPTSLLTPKPSTTARASQSLAAPSVNAAASTTTPTNTVRGSVQPTHHRGWPVAGPPVSEPVVVGSFPAARTRADCSFRNPSPKTVTSSQVTTVAT